MTAAKTMRMRRFQLHRDEDETGTSGTGIVAEGCEFTDGSYALTWLSPFKTCETGDAVKFGTSAARGCQACSHRFTRFDEKPIPCFSCSYFQAAT